jgi:anti-anti-sigma factor
MQITELSKGNWTILNLDGKIDNEGADILQPKLLPLMKGGQVALDFTKVEYVTSSGFRVLMVALRQQTSCGGRLLVGSMSKDVARYFEIAGLHTYFKLVPDIYSVINAS